jgi:hypothetical protein
MARHLGSRLSAGSILATVCLGLSHVANASTIETPDTPSIFSPASTPADSIFRLSLANQELL